MISGDKGDTGNDGQDGYTPVKGTDYFTPQEIQDIEDDILEDIDVKPQVFYWDGTTNQTALDLWNEIYQLNKTTDIVVIQKVSDVPFIYLFTKNWNFAQYNKALTPIKEISVSSSYDSYYTYYYSVGFVVQNNAITSILKNQNQTQHNFLDASKDYARDYTPLYNNSPATKKYVDDSIANAVSGLSSTLTSIEGVVG